MILAISRFRVINGRHIEVREAFLNRPRLVESAPGFIAMEVFTDIGDDRTFYLVTRWADEQSFRLWHRSEAHRSSHKGIPKGLKLDPAYTRLEIVSRLDDPDHWDRRGNPRWMA